MFPLVEPIRFAVGILAKQAVLALASLKEAPYGEGAAASCAPVRCENGEGSDLTISPENCASRSRAKASLFK